MKKIAAIISAVLLVSSVLAACGKVASVPRPGTFAREMEQRGYAVEETEVPFAENALVATNGENEIIYCTADAEDMALLAYISIYTGWDEGENENAAGSASIFILETMCVGDEYDYNMTIGESEDTFYGAYQRNKTALSVKAPLENEDEVNEIVGALGY